MINVYERINNVDIKLTSLPNSKPDDFKNGDEIEVNDNVYTVLNKKFYINDFGVSSIGLIVNKRGA